LCTMDLSLSGEPCYAPGAVICICSAAGKVIPNNTLYAFPGDSISMQCLACGEGCFDPHLVVSNSIEIFPSDQVCSPPGNTWTEVFNMSAPIQFPQPYLPTLCCEPPSSYCFSGANYLHACTSSADCGGLPCTSGCFEYGVGRPEQQACTQLGGGSSA